MTCIAFFGDLHGNVQATEAVLADIDAREPDHITCLGDLVGYGANPNEVIERVRNRNIPVIMGNYDDGIGFSRGDCGCAYRDETEKANGEKSVAWTANAITDENKIWLAVHMRAIDRRSIFGFAGGFLDNAMPCSE